jgi:hypothetical protein
MYLTDAAWIFPRYKSVTFDSGGSRQDRSAALTDLWVGVRTRQAIDRIGPIGSGGDFAWS